MSTWSCLTLKGLDGLTEQYIAEVQPITGDTDLLWNLMTFDAKIRPGEEEILSRLLSYSKRPARPRASLPMYVSLAEISESEEFVWLAGSSTSSSLSL